MKRGLASMAAFAALLALLAASPAQAQGRWTFDFETGAAVPGYNDVALPGTVGTRFSLSRDLRSDPTAYWRVRVDFRAAPKHVVSVLAAPLEFEPSGTLGFPVEFDGLTFPAGVPLEGLYRFDSYRFTYRYEFVQGERWRFGIGVTGKIRDANIRLGGGGQVGEDPGVGFVPLVNFKLERTLTPRLGLLLEGDALAAPQGRAEDVLAALVINLGGRGSLKVGYRFLEGGADTDRVYTFALVHYLAVGAQVRF